MKLSIGRLCSAVLLLFSLVCFADPLLAQVHTTPSSPDVNTETPQHRHGLPMGLQVRPDGSIAYNNWSGYRVNGATNSVTDVKGSWTVSPVTCTLPNSTYSSAWVGIDDDHIEQVGTESDCRSNGPVYYAWYQFLPQEKDATIICINPADPKCLPVEPGDQISAEVSFDISSGLFTVTITDKQKDGTIREFSKSEAVEGAPRSTAEWVVEDPSTGSCLGPLANFGKVNFTQDQAALDGLTGPIGSFAANVAMTMIGDGKFCSPAGVIEAIPSELSNNESGFSVSSVDFKGRLYSFEGGSDGGGPTAGLIFDRAGNLYGTAEGAGANSCGTVFGLTPSAAFWTETILHVFSCDFTGDDGFAPTGDLTFDGAGNLYGTTYYGGANGYGTIFELTLSGGAWKETILHSFTGNDGSNPYGSLIFDKAGNLYGTTLFGGENGDGVVFELKPSQGGWAETVLHSFAGSDGLNPNPSLTFDRAGNLYGTTNSGGASGLGTVFELMRSGGTWTEHVLYSFTTVFPDGTVPGAGVIFDSAGNLYGTTSQGGSSNGGTVFELMPSNGGWTEAILYSFNVVSGYQLEAGLTFDKAGNLYGTTWGGGANGDGVVFELTPSKSGWVESVLHNFNGSDGYLPYGLVIDSTGNLYGMADQGGANGDGVVFELTP
jgi:uncharacterized repeat protein (TIGR03803 family)